MKGKMLHIKTALITFCAVFTVTVGLALAQDKKDQPKASGDEQKAVKKIQDAKDIAAKIKAAGEFVKKYPKSSLRPAAANLISMEIAKLTDPAQKVSYGEQFFSTFTESSETDEVAPYLIDAYIKTNKHDEAFQVAGNFFSRHPEDVLLLADIGVQGSNLARTSNGKFAGQSATYTNKAIELIEANKKPSTYDDARWNNYKTNNLPSLYQASGVLAMLTGKNTEAKQKLEKAAALNPADPFNYYLVGKLIDDEYQRTAKLYNIAPAGKEKDDLLSKASGQLDQVIDYYARAVAAADGKPNYQEFASQLKTDLESYYKYRNKNSADGLQKLIDKYKQAKP